MVKASDFLIALDDGHGMGTAGKRTPFIKEIDRFIHENEFNREAIKYLDIELRRCGFKTLLVAPTDADTSLATRTNLANSKGADAYVSIHYDAMDGKFDGQGKDPEGITVLYHPNSPKGKKLAEIVNKHLIKGTAQKNRGCRTRTDLHVLNATKMPAILTENGFMDNKVEALLMLNVSFQKEVAREHAQGICEYFGVKYVPEAQPEPKKAIGGVSNVTEPELNKEQEAIRQEAIALGITDGKNPHRAVNQFYTWAIALPLAKRIAELEKIIKDKK